MDDWVVEIVHQENLACNEVISEIKECIYQEKHISRDLSIRTVDNIENAEIAFIDESPSKMA